jgi:hypothetical protein
LVLIYQRTAFSIVTVVETLNLTLPYYIITITRFGPRISIFIKPSGKVKPQFTV